MSDQEKTPFQKAFIEALQASERGERISDETARILNTREVAQTNPDTLRDNSHKDTVTKSA